MRFEVLRDLRFVRNGNGLTLDTLAAGEQIETIPVESLRSSFARTSFERIIRRHKADGEPGGPLVVFEWLGLPRCAIVGPDLGPIRPNRIRLSDPAPRPSVALAPPDPAPGRAETRDGESERHSVKRKRWSARIADPSTGGGS